jgi:hypothetical protein
VNIDAQVDKSGKLLKDEMKKIAAERFHFILDNQENKQKNKE